MKVIKCIIDGVCRIIPKWTLLATLGRSKIVSTTILMPVIGYFLLFNDKVVSVMYLSAELLGIEEQFTQEQSLLSLRLLYLGLGFFAMASIIFKVRCPKSINETGSPESFIHNYLPLMDPQFHSELKTKVSAYGPCELVNISLINEVISHDAPLENSHAAKHPGSLQQISLPNHTYDQWMNINRAQFTMILRAFFMQEDCSRALARFFATILYAGGFLLVLKPSATVFVTVTSTLLGF